MRDSFEYLRTGFMNKRIYLSSPTMHGLEMKYIQEAFDTNWVAPLGKNVDEFEKEMAAYIGVKHAAAMVSGTSALHLAIKLCGFKPGDIVICSDLTFSATVNPVSYEGGIQVFVDSECDTWNMDPKALEIALKKYPQAKAVLVAHLYGTPAKMDEILALCEQYNVPMIEDAAESLGATYKGRQTGTFGKYAALSYNGNKIITTSGGGMFLSDDEAAVKKVRFWATQSRDPAPHYQHSEIGYNYRMSNIVAGIGRGQLVYLNDHIQKKRQIYETYKQAFKNLPVQMNPHTADSEPNYWLSCMLIDKEYTKVTYQQIMEALLHENIESRPIWKPMHLQPVFQHNDFITVDKDTDVGGDIFSRGLCLPSDIKITEEEQTRVISIIKGFFK
jgi:dTDP-4-amino-4,6-dideoxygalactose transaminase